jgi:hypothetical protein
MFSLFVGWCRSVAELEEEVFVQKATQDTLDMLEAEGRIAGYELEALVRQQGAEMAADGASLTQEEEEVREEEEEFSVEAINTRAYLLWIENGRPHGADFGDAAREWMWEAHRGGR